MFKLFKSRPPIIIINEAEHKEPPPVIVEKTLWQKYFGIICITTVVLHFIAVAFILNMMNEIKYNQNQVNTALLTHLQLTDSLYNVASTKRYSDSVLTEKRYTIADNTNKIVFAEFYKQLKIIERQNAQYFKTLQEIQKTR